MDRIGKEQKLIILLKYIYMIGFVLFFIEEGSLSTELLVILLAGIILNQTRFFIVRRKNFYYYASLVLEFTLSAVIYNFSGRFGFLIFLPALVDVSTGISSVFSAGCFFLIVLFNLIFKGRYDDLITSVICSLPIILLGGIVREEYGEKIKAQRLYDRLREREEELKRVNQELENSVNTIEEITVLRERNRISREIHDNVGHALSTMIIQLGAIASLAPSKGGEAAAMAANLGKFADESLQSVRAAVRSMKPREFEEYEGIVAVSEMIKNFEKLSGITVRLRVSEVSWKLNSDQTMVIYRIIQEFLSNSLRHGRASEARVFLNFLPGSLRIYMKDNGAGCSRITEGTGLRSIRERVKVWGGNVEYFSSEDQGFEVVATLEKGRLGMDGTV